MNDQNAITPQRTQEQPEEKALTKIQNYLEAPMIKARFAQMMGERGASTYISSVLLAVADSRSLQQCQPPSIYTSALRAATLRMSVDPGVGQAYLVPFKGKATLIIGYKGLYDMAVRTGKYRYINVGPVYEGEDVIEDRITGFHRLAGNKTGKAIIGWLGAFEMMNGYAKTFYMTHDEIHAHAKQYSAGYDYKDNHGEFTSLWKKEPAKMERKTVLRLMLRRWGYMDPADVQVLDVLEDERPETVEAEFNTIAEDLSKRAPEEELPRSKEQNLRALGFETSGNTDPISDKQWTAWLALCQRAEKVNIPYNNLIVRENTTAADLTAEHQELIKYVTDAEQQFKAGAEPQD